MGTWPVYGNPTLGLFLNHSKLIHKEREKGRDRERERKEYYLIATCLTRVPAGKIYNEKQRRAFKGNLLT